MNKKTAMSAMGYAIVFVIVLGIIMIISAPMLVNNTKNKKAATELPKPVQTFEETRYDTSRLREVEERLSSRIDNLERNQSGFNSDIPAGKYICTFEGNIDEYGNVVPSDSPQRDGKFAFVCEYR